MSCLLKHVFACLTNTLCNTAHRLSVYQALKIIFQHKSNIFKAKSKKNIGCFVKKKTSTFHEPKIGFVINVKHKIISV